MDTLEITNAEQDVMWMQLKGIRQAWEATNIKLRSIGGQLGGINWALEYLTRMAWKRYAATQGGLASKRGGRLSEGAARQETQEASMGTNKIVDKEAVEVPEGDCKGAEDEGEGPSGLSAADKGKGKEKETGEEGTLQEE